MAGAVLECKVLEMSDNEAETFCGPYDFLSFRVC